MIRGGDTEGMRQLGEVSLRWNYESQVIVISKLTCFFLTFLFVLCNLCMHDISESYVNYGLAGGFKYFLLSSLF